MRWWWVTIPSQTHASHRGPLIFHPRRETGRRAERLTGGGTGSSRQDLPVGCRAHAPTNSSSTTRPWQQDLRVSHGPDFYEICGASCNGCSHMKWRNLRASISYNQWHSYHNQWGITRLNQSRVNKVRYLHPCITYGSSQGYNRGIHPPGGFLKSVGCSTR